MNDIINEQETSLLRIMYIYLYIYISVLYQRYHLYICEIDAVLKRGDSSILTSSQDTDPDPDPLDLQDFGFLDQDPQKYADPWKKERLKKFPDF